MKHRLGWLLFVGGATSALLLAGGQQDIKPVVAQAVDEGCPETTPPATQTGTTLETFATDSNSGVVYDAGLKLQKAGGLFQSTSFGLASDAHGVCTADFDNDGWVDIMSTSYRGGEILLSLNKTLDNQLAPNLPDWSDPTYVTTPKFEASYYISQNCIGQNGHAAPSYCDQTGDEALSCADFDGDGNADFMFVRRGKTNSPAGIPHSATMYLGNGDGTFGLGYQAATPSEFKYIVKSTTMLPIDFNGDDNLDLVVGGTSDSSVANKGHVQVFLNDGATPPNFVQSTPLVTNSNMGPFGINTLAYADFTGDGFDDLVITSATAKKIHMFPGLSGGGLQSTLVDITNDYPGAAAMVLAADFSLDGRADLILASDDYGYPDNDDSSTGVGGLTHYYTNNSSATPFSDGITQTLTTRGNPFNDFDMASVFQYDNDPDGTPDFVVANGNGSSAFRVFANRTIGLYNICGDVQSGILDLGALSAEEMVITAARLEPTLNLPFGTSITFYMSNETPENWQLANPCVDDSTSYCVSFPKPTGREVKWKATMCSNAAQTLTPTITSVDVSFDYTEAEEHYRAGVVVDDGVAYVGAFRQPGDSGHFYALNAGLGQTYWDFADSLNTVSDVSRHVYTSDTAGTTRLDFTVANTSSTSLQATLGVASASQASDVVTWQRSTRFGVDEDSRLGSVENSTPAVVGAPALPNWYPRADDATRAKVDAFIAEHADRDKIVLVGSKDGALHAVRSDPVNVSSTVNGTEAWAYIPAKVASGMLADFSNGTATSYPDGSPTVGDVILSDGEVHTVAVVSGGNGNRSVFALDITETIDEDNGTIIGPTPLWHIIPGDSDAGQATSKPVIARVLIGGASKFIAIMATGVAAENPTAPYTKGRDVVAVDISNGTVLWKFQTKCAVTSDIATFETNDVAEPGLPTIDGYIDRAVFADACGYVYKVDPGQNVGTGHILGIGSVPTGHTDPDLQAVNAIFGTLSTTCALLEERPIAGTIGVRPDGTNRIALFFGTGGIESYDPTENNDFYAVYADSGEIRGCSDSTPELGRIQGTCTANVCEKFYGGVVVTNSDIIVTRASDPPVGTGTCEFGTSEITGFSTSEFNESFSVTTTSSTVSSLYGDGDALYFATLGGDIVRVGTPRAENAGDDTTNGTGGGQAAPDGDGSAITGGAGGMSIHGWNMLQ